jgi:chromosome segregation ATPase
MPVDDLLRFGIYLAMLANLGHSIGESTMESTFVWILMFAGAAVALLGLFLIASERELKTKRREIDGLLARLENIPRVAPDGSSDRLEDGAAAADLRAQNRELETKLSALAGELAQSRQTVDALQAAQRDHSGEQEEIRRLMSANDQLARELQAARQNLPNLSAIEAERGQERQAFQEQISNLEKRLAMEQQNLSEMQTLRDRLAEADNVQRSLRAEISRHEDEIPRWQARIAAAEESGQRLAALQAPCNELLSRHAELADRQRRLQEELAAFARQITAPADGFQPSGSTFAEPAKGVEPV